MPSSVRLTLRQLFEPNGLSVCVPKYQRHYLWGQYREGERDSVEYLTDCLIDAFNARQTYFLQSITLCGDHLVDGQQRMTYLALLLRMLGAGDRLTIDYEFRPAAQRFLVPTKIDEDKEADDELSQDIYYFKRTLRVIRGRLLKSQIKYADFLPFVLDNIELLVIRLPEDTDEIAMYKMMNGTKGRMAASDVIKADILRLASDVEQPFASDWQLTTMRSRYAQDWDNWVRWWLRDSVKTYYGPLAQSGIDMLLKLCLRGENGSFDAQLTYVEFIENLSRRDIPMYQAAKHFFDLLRRTQRRFEAAFDDPETYNRIRAILLLQRPQSLFRFLYLYFVKVDIDKAELERYYKLSFLGMNIHEIYHNEPYAERFDDLMASLSMADVYHSETKRDVFNLLLRLNIDEDIKLGRRFDFSIWSNRSLEHIYSKSKVWHLDAQGRLCDGNDNVLHLTLKDIEKDPTYVSRDSIVNLDGTHLSEHCLGNLVLLYGQNNAMFGNTGFEQKKMMFLTPGDGTVFLSRNLLHTVCVFAANSWTPASIVDNYNLTLKNLKIYYGLK